jgi:hypothetical protein
MLSGCTHVVWVTDKKNEDNARSEKVDGIPFYVKTEQFRHTTVWIKTWLTATLTVEKKSIDTTNGKEAQTDSGKQVITKQLLKSDSPQLNSIRRALITANNKDVKDALKIVDDFEKLPSLPDDKAVVPIMLKNAIESEWVVDRSRQYYLNAPLPWFGTGNLSQELSADGTLSKASSSADTKLAEAIGTLLPLKEFLSGKFATPAAAAAKDDSMKIDAVQGVGILQSFNPKLTQKEAQYVYVLSLSVEEAGYQYTLSKWPEAAKPPIAAIAIDATDALVSRTDLKADNAGKKTEDGQKIGISGSIDLPKDWGAAKTEPKK